MTNRNMLPQLLKEQMLEHALSRPYVEICGLIGGMDNQPTTIYTVENIAEDQKHNYLMDPQQQISVMRTMRDKNETLWGIYHSHPDAPAGPSATDKALASYPDTYYIIISMAKSTPDINIFYFDGKAFINPCDKDD